MAIPQPQETPEIKDPLSKEIIEANPIFATEIEKILSLFDRTIHKKATALTGDIPLEKIQQIRRQNETKKRKVTHSDTTNLQTDTLSLEKSESGPSLNFQIITRKKLGIIIDNIIAGETRTLRIYKDKQALQKQNGLFGLPTTESSKQNPSALPFLQEFREKLLQALIENHLKLPQSYFENLQDLRTKYPEETYIKIARIIGLIDELLPFRDAHECDEVGNSFDIKCFDPDNPRHKYTISLSQSIESFGLTVKDYKGKNPELASPFEPEDTETTHIVINKTTDSIYALCTVYNNINRRIPGRTIEREAVEKFILDQVAKMLAIKLVSSQIIYGKYDR